MKRSMLVRILIALSLIGVASGGCIEPDFVPAGVAFLGDSVVALNDLPGRMDGLIEPETPGSVVSAAHVGAFLNSNRFSGGTILAQFEGLLRDCEAYHADPSNPPVQVETLVLNGGGNDLILDCLYGSRSEEVPYCSATVGMLGGELDKLVDRIHGASQEHDFMRVERVVYLGYYYLDDDGNKSRLVLVNPALESSVNQARDRMNGYHERPGYEGIQFLFVDLRPVFWTQEDPVSGEVGPLEVAFPDFPSCTDPADDCWERMREEHPDVWSVFAFNPLIEEDQMHPTVAGVDAMARALCEAVPSLGCVPR